MGLILDTTFTDVAMPVGQSLAAAILANSHLTQWFQADEPYLSLSGSAIATWTDRKGSGKTLTQATSGKRATLAEAALGSYQAAEFASASAQEYVLTGGTVPWNGAFSIAVVAKLASSAAGNRMLIGAASSNTFYMGRLTANTLRLRVGGNAEVAVSDETDWNYVIGAYDGTSTVKIAANGGTLVSATGSDPTVAGNTAVGAIGQGGGSNWNGHIADLMIFDYDIHNAANGTDLALLEEYFSTVYGLGG
jgi:Concanavalin A-like lectin/glucanases superfamily